MALTIVETPITGGVDTHADVHVAAALDPVGGLLGVAEFPVTPAGYARLLSWLSGFGTVCLAGIEGTGSYGAGLARHVSTVGCATRIALRGLGRRGQFFDGQLERLDELIVPLVPARAPGLLALYGVGPDTAALLLIAAGDHPARLRSEAAWAHLCAAAPIPASSGKVTRRRLNPGGNREASHALWRIVVTPVGSPAPTPAHVRRRREASLSQNEDNPCPNPDVAPE